MMHCDLAAIMHSKLLHLATQRNVSHVRIFLIQLS